MPLTIDEAIAAIRALDTEKDIIFRACERITRPETQQTTSREIAIQVLQRYRNEEASEVITGFAVALGRQASLSCKPGHETDMMEAVYGQVAEAFQQGLLVKFKLAYEVDRSKAIESLIATVRNLSSVGKKET